MLIIVVPENMLDKPLGSPKFLIDGLPDLKGESKKRRLSLIIAKIDITFFLRYVWFHFGFLVANSGENKIDFGRCGSTGR